MSYNFNPRDTANHFRLRYMGSKGSCHVQVGNHQKDMKFDSPCAEYYHAYQECLKKSEFNRNTCRPAENWLTECEKEKMSSMKPQLKILKNWRKNKGEQVVPAFVPYKLTDQEPQRVHK